MDFNKLNGIVPAIIQDARSQKVLMLGFMTPEALEQTNFDLAIYAFSGEISQLTFLYNANIYNRYFMEKIPSHMEKVVDQIIENEQIKIRDIQLETNLAAIEPMGFDGTQPDFNF